MTQKKTTPFLERLTSREKRLKLSPYHHIMFILLFISLAGCAHGRPIMLSERFSNPTKDRVYRQWCEFGVEVACIDLNYSRWLRSGKSKLEYIDELRDYCDLGYGSACYYLGQEYDPSYLERACALHELRACPWRMRDWARTPPDNTCAAESSHGDKVKGLEPSQAYRKIQRTVHAQHRNYTYCYERKLLGTRGLSMKSFEGVIRLSFLFEGPETRPSEVAVTCSDFHDQEVERCMSDIIRTLTLEDSEEFSWPTRVNYPFLFSME